MSEIAESDIAIIGMGGRFPGADDVEAFWTNLLNGVESIRRLSDAELRETGIAEEVLANPDYVKAAPMLSDVEGFDAGLFGISPREAEVMDPQQRLFIETAWHALEDAGYGPGTIRAPVGVFAGAGLSSYLLHHLWDNARVSGRVLQAGIGNENDYVATRVGYHLNLRGPCVNVQSACSTSLVAVHLASQALLAGECDMALAGGVTIALPARAGYTYQEGAMFSPDGHCRAFDQEAGGTVFSRGGVGAVVLKRLVDALDDGDSVVAVVKGSAVNNDGAVRAGFAAPSVNGQARVIEEALAVADVDPSTIGFVEAHGTGTSIGDPIEVSALKRVYGRFTDRREYCALGSLKTNVGHLNRAAGVAGLIKAALAVRSGTVPPTLHFRKANPRLGLEESPFFVNSEPFTWERNGSPRRAGVSSFGVGGTNAHVVVEEAPATASGDAGWPRQLLVLSARNEEPLSRLAEATARRLEADGAPGLADVAYTLQVGRRPMARRLQAVAGDAAGAAEALRRAARKTPAVASGEPPPVAFLFPGQGAQYPAMAAGLYAADDGFRSDVDQCCDAIRDDLGFDLREVLFPAPEQTEEAAERLQRTAVTQPALFIVEHSLARLWQRWGIEPRAMLGHSLGEYVAACLAGVFSLEDGLGLVAERGRLMESAPPGSMLSVSAPEEVVGEHLLGEAELAVVNGPSRCVVAGTDDAIREVEARLQEREIPCRRLHTSHAFHCTLMEPILEPFRRRVAQVDLEAPRIPFLSNRTGSWISEEEAISPDYWVDHLRHTVRFGAGVETLLEEDRLLVEVGPGGVLTPLVRRHPAAGRGRTVVASLPAARKPDDDLGTLLDALGTLWGAGLEPAWERLHRGAHRRRVSLPGYPFEHRRYWIDPPPKDRPLRQKLVKRPDVADWFYTPSWRPSHLATVLGRQVDPGEPWLVLAGDDAGSAALLRTLREAAARVTVVRPGESFAAAGDGEWTVRPGVREDLAELVSALGDDLPRRIVHLWSSEPDDEGEAEGFYTLLALAQALEEGSLGEGRSVTVLTRHLQPVAGGQPRGIGRATLLGPCRVLPVEIPGLTVRSLDVDAGGEELARLLLAEVQSGSSEPFVAWRAGRRYLLGYEPVRLGREVEDDELPLRDGGVYLITGGFGGLGLTLAEYLARTAGARLALLGRTELPDRERWEEAGAEVGEPVRRRIANVRALEALGAEVLPLSADVGDRRAMAAAVDEVCRRFGGVDGVFHTAGRAGGGRAVFKSPEAAAAVLEPKVAGTRSLAAALEGREPDFLVLFSSVIAIVGVPGQIDYSAGNAFLDLFAHRHAARSGVRTLAVDWDVWAEVGMAVRMRGEQGEAQPPAVPELHEALDLAPVQQDGDGARGLAAILSSQRHWLVAEHRVRGVPAMPGTGFLELAVRAGGDAPVELREVVFLRPLLVPETGQRVRVMVTRDGSGAERFRVEAAGQEEGGGDGRGWEQHAEGSVLPLEGEPAAMDLAALDAVERKRIPQHQLERSGASMELVWWGPRWSAVRSLEVGEDDVVARLELPEPFLDDLRQYRLHPALMDLATGLGSVLASGPGYLPLSYRRVRVFRSLPRKLVSHVRRADAAGDDGSRITFDVTLADEEGEVLVEVEGFAMQRVGGKAAGRAKTGAGRRRKDEGILPREGMKALRLALARAEAPQLVVSPRELHLLELEAVASGRTLKERDKERQEDRHPRPEMATQLVAPRTPLERQLVEIWRDVLGIDEIGVDDDFLELGGDSVVGIQIVSRSRAVGLALDPDLLFEQPTVARLAAALAEREDGETRPGEQETLAAETAAAAGERFPATPLQRAMVEHPGAAPGSSVYRLQVVLRFDSALPPERMSEAWNRVVAHQPVLRTVFVAGEDGGLDQEVRPPEPREVPFLDWSGGAERRLEERWRELLQEKRAEAIDPSRLPLVRPLLVRTGSGEDRLLIQAHHAVLDGWSLGLLFQQLGQALAGEPLPPALPFRRFVEERAGGSADEDHWRALLDGAAVTPVADVNVREDSGPAERGLATSTADADALDALGREAGVSAATAVLGAWALTLAAESGDEAAPSAPTLGLVLSGRNLPLAGAASALGLFINVLPLRIPAVDGGLATWLQEIQSRQRELQRRENTPLAAVEAACGGGPLFETVVRFQNLPLELIGAVPGLRGLEWDDAWPYPLDLEVRPHEGMDLRLSYDRSRVDAAMAARLLERLGNLLSRMAASPQGPLADLLVHNLRSTGRIV